MNRITGQIWLGSSADAANLEGDIDAVLNCAFDLANPNQWSRVLLAQCGLMDGPGNPLAAYYSAVTQLANLVNLGRKILVHCHQGESRSVAVVLCYLNALDLERQGWDYWLYQVRQRHPIPEGKPLPAHRDAFHAMDWLTMHSLVRRDS